MPRALATALAVGIKGSLQIQAAGFPAFSTVSASCRLHELQEPQSPMAVMTRSLFSSSESMICLGAGLETSPLFSSTTPLN